MFQSVLDWSKEYNTRYGVPTNTKEQSKKHGMMAEYLNRKVFPDFSTLIAKYTNMRNISITHVFPTNISSAVSFAILMVDENIGELVAKEISFSDANVRGATSFERQIMLAESLNRKEGKYEELVKLVKYTILFPIGGFLLPEIFPTKIQLTAKELTAIFLHEIGHFMTLLETRIQTSFSAYFGNSLYAETITDMNNYPEETKKSIEKTIKDIKKSDVYKESKGVKKLVKYVENHKDLVFEKGKEPSYLNIGWIFALYLTVMKTVSVLGISAATVAMLQTQEFIKKSVNPFLGSTDRALNVDVRKSSYSERLADEYVSRYFMSKYLVSALDKFNDFFTEQLGTSTYFPIHSKTLRESKLLVYSLRAFNILTFLQVKILNTNVEGTYEGNFTRLKRNVENLKGALKDKDMPKEVRNQILDDIEEMEAVIKKQSRTVLTGAATIITVFFTILTKLEALPLTMLQGNLGNSYSKFFKAVDSLLANDYYKKAAELERIFDR
jgi:CRISPR/Cas system-associated endonuclease Cas3-HD